MHTLSEQEARNRKWFTRQQTKAIIDRAPDMATSVLKAATSTPNIPVAATISEVDRAVLERMSKGSPENLDLGSSAESLRLKKILHGRPPSSSTSFSSDSDESNDSSAKSRVSEGITD